MQSVLLYRAIRRLRPAPLGVAAKRLAGIHRRDIDTPQGRFHVDPCSDVGYTLVTRGEYEPNMCTTLERLLRPGATFVDVGANEGYFSVIASRLVGRGGRVVAIEPQDRLAPVLRRNFEMNDCANVTLETSAVSDREADAEMFLAPEINTGSSGFTEMTRYRLPSQPVRTATLEAILARHDIADVDLMKMDVEGYEWEAILGSKAIFTAPVVRSIALELHPDQLASRGLDPGAILDFLLEEGYRRDERFGNLVLTRSALGQDRS